MKYYDNYGYPHKTMIGAMGASVTKRFNGSTAGYKLDKAAKMAEEQIDKIVDKSSEFSDEKITTLSNSITSSMISQLHDPIQSFLKEYPDSEITQRKFIEAIFGVVGSEIRKNPDLFMNSYDRIIHKFTKELTRIIILKAKQPETDSNA